MENRQQIDIIEISEYADAIRSTGYKDIESAISEIVDNSLEANAKNVYIIFEETIKPGESRKKITNVYFLDDGHGMNIDTLQKCLVLGSGTKKIEGVSEDLVLGYHNHLCMPRLRLIFTHGKMVVITPICLI